MGSDWSTKKPNWLKRGSEVPHWSCSPLELLLVVDASTLNIVCSHAHDALDIE